MTTIYTTEIHLRERTDSTPDERYFDGWLVGAQNVFPCINIMCAMDSARAIRWACEVERRAFEWSNAKKITPDGKPSDARIDTVRIYENFRQDDKPVVVGVVWVN